GFYAPAQLVRDARAHGVEVRAVDACVSEWDATLERRADGEPALRLGMRLVKSLSQPGVTRLLAARTQRPFASVSDLAARAALDRDDLEALAAAGALASLSGNRHLAFWEVAARERPMPLGFAPARRADLEEGRPLLAAAPARRIAVVADLVILEIAGELGGVLVLEQPLEPAPGRVADLLPAALGEIKILDDLIKIDVAVLRNRLVGFLVFEFL